MSSLPTSPGAARPLRSPVAGARPRLTVVAARGERTGRVPFVTMVVTLLGLGLVGLLVLNTSLQRGTYAVTDLRSQAAQLDLREQNLQLEVARLQSPQRVASLALGLGMVRNDSPAFLSLQTGKVVGVATAGQRGNQFVLDGVGTAIGSRGKVALVVAGSSTSGAIPVVRVSGDKPEHTTGSPPGQRRPGSGPSEHRGAR